jgi:hypothetical protein
MISNNINKEDFYNQNIKINKVNLFNLKNIYKNNKDNNINKEYNYNINLEDTVINKDISLNNIKNSYKKNENNNFNKQSKNKLEKDEKRELDNYFSYNIIK